MLLITNRFTEIFFFFSFDLMMMLDCCPEVDTIGGGDGSNSSGSIVQCAVLVTRCVRRRSIVSAVSW